MRHRLASVCFAAVVAGCSSTTPVPTTVVTGGMPNAEAALQQSIRNVDAEMAKLGSLRAPEETAPDSDGVPADLRRVVNFTFAGPLDSAVAQLAQSIGYTFFTTRAQGARTVAVAVNVRGGQVYQVFQILGDQAGQRATVAVDPIHHAVQVIHHA